MAFGQVFGNLHFWFVNFNFVCLFFFFRFFCSCFRLYSMAAATAADPSVGVWEQLHCFFFAWGFSSSPSLPLRKGDLSTKCGWNCNLQIRVWIKKLEFFKFWRVFEWEMFLGAKSSTIQRVLTRSGKPLTISSFFFSFMFVIFLSVSSFSFPYFFLFSVFLLFLLYLFSLFFVLLLWICSFSPLLLRGAAWSPPSLALFSSPFTWCCLVSSLFGCCPFSLSFLVVLSSIPSIGWCCLWGGVLPVFCWVVLLRFLPSMGGVAVFPAPVRWCCSLSSGGVAFLLSFCVVLLGFFPSVGGVACYSFSCLVALSSSSSFLGGAAFPLLFCWVMLLGLLSLLWVELLFFSLSCSVVLPSFSSFGWCCVISRLLLRWCCLVSSFLGVVFFSFLRGAAWFLPSLGGLSCLVVLPTIPSIG